MTEMSAETVNRVKDEVRESFPWRVDPFKRTKDNVAIVGFTAHREEAMALDDSWEIWGLNELHRYMPVERFHRWFEIHDRAVLQKDPGGPEHLADLAKMDIPVYMHQHWDDIGPSLPFPADEIVENLGRDYFTCCPAWMLGMAVAMGFRRIAMYGVDMATQSEYESQRPACEYWLGVAAGRGVEVSVPDTSDLLKCIGRYGYDSGDLFVKKIDERMRFLHDKDNSLLQAIRGLDGEYRQKHNAMMGVMERARGALGEARLGRQTAKMRARVEVLLQEIANAQKGMAALDEQYESKREALKSERLQIVGGIQDCTFWRQSWGVTSAVGSTTSMPDRSKDPRTGVTAPYQPQAQSVDSPEPEEAVR
jgi:hypothetical protein